MWSDKKYETQQKGEDDKKEREGTERGKCWAITKSKLPIGRIQIGRFLIHITTSNQPNPNPNPNSNLRIQRSWRNVVANRQLLHIPNHDIPDW